MQQIAYAILDTEDAYGISRLAWIYPRQQQVFVYPLRALCPDIDTFRREFWETFYHNKRKVHRTYDFDPLGDDDIPLYDLLGLDDIASQTGRGFLLTGNLGYHPDQDEGDRSD